MIGDDSTRRRPAPTSTGNVPSFVAAGDRRRGASAGGSSSDTNAPPSTASIVCTATSERQHGVVAPGAGRRPVGRCSRPSTTTFTSGPGPSARSARDPHAALDRLPAPDEPPGHGPSGRPQDLDVLAGREAERVVRRRRAAGSGDGRSRSTACSTASSQGTCRVPSTSRPSTGANPPSAVARLDAPALHLEAADPHGDGRRRRRGRRGTRSAPTSAPPPSRLA